METTTTKHPRDIVRHYEIRSAGVLGNVDVYVDSCDSLAHAMEWFNLGQAGPNMSVWARYFDGGREQVATIDGPSTEPVGFEVDFGNGMFTFEPHLQDAAYLVGRFGGSVSAVFADGTTEALTWV